jgi:NADH dehydrogenase
MSTLRPKVVVVGAGFGGLNAVTALAKAPVDITLIDRNNYHLFQPLLYQVATAALAPSDIASPVRAIFAGRKDVEVLFGEVDGVDPRARTVSVRDMGAIPFDHLVLATGAVSSWFGHDDWAAHATALKTLADAERLRLRLLGAFELAEACADPEEIRRLLTFVVIGGGSSGVELAGAIRELARRTLARDFRRIQTDTARVVLYEAGPTVLAGYPDGLIAYASRQLGRLGVEIHTGVQVEQVDGAGIVAGGERLHAANVFWCAGVAATPVAGWLGVKPAKHGAVAIEPDCSVPGHPNIFAIGDAASLNGPDGHPLPGVASVAKQQGRYVAQVIAARVAGTAPPNPFRYRDQGSLAIIGQSRAVANLPRLKMTGFPAWLIWSCVHLFLLVGLRNRILVYVQWVWAWLFSSRGDRIMVADAKTVRAAERNAAAGPETLPTL